MDIEKDIKEKAQEFINKVKNNQIRIIKAYLYGSYAKGRAHKDSDIDIALVSPDFSGNRYFDTLKIISLRRMIDNRIEPVPYKPEDFDESDPLVAEIKNTGIVIN